MFSLKSIWFFLCSAILIIISYVCMAIDPEPNGFGILTLWIAPPSLLLGFILIIPGIIGMENMPTFKRYAMMLFTWKNAFGLLVFSIAFTTYLITLEPT